MLDAAATYEYRAPPDHSSVFLYVYNGDGTVRSPLGLDFRLKEHSKIDHFSWKIMKIRHPAIAMVPKAAGNRSS